ncbi:uncharacterized protein LOC112516947 [Cynara cardunculus var. scolymus]|uniref:Zinc finger, TRAF-type n=1 Tax=Cynara cardunculus var. scolymus TaxID=59895 RepID=A0A124SCF5_CYNCS|nr:uncharacterized protein LOC112516947 [Cynara cardunculus var. scolymus]KVH93625.1 Zinc finger, TRAF-type [Cynara cardunculus var. scolymus]
MEPPVAAEVETKSQETDETKVSPKSYECGLCDTEVVYKIAQELLPGLASACVDNTTGGIFKSAGSIAADMRKEMADYLTQRSESYVAEFLLNENASGIEISEHPYDIIISLIDDFAASKRNMFSRVSEWVLSDRREDRIDDFVQEMEINGFWLLPRRECVSSMLLKNVDYKNAFHCNMVCSSEEEVAAHRSECKFRPLDCMNEGCTTRYCAAQKEHHEAVCPFMILPCEQKCSDFVMRREMDRHCVTICPMKLVNCAFYTVGCQSSIPRCNVQQHNADDLSSHLRYIIRAAHKEATDEDLKHRVEQILNLSNTEKLARARDARALTYLIKDAEAKLGPLEVEGKPDSKEKNTSKEDSNKTESPTKTEPSVKDGSELEPPPNKNEMTEKVVESPAKMVESKESYSSAGEEDEKKKGSREEESKEIAAKEEDPIKQEPSHSDQELETTKTPPKKEEERSSNKQSFSSDEQESKKPPKEDESSNKQSFSSGAQDTKKLPKNETSSRGGEKEEEAKRKEKVKKSSAQREKTTGSDEEESMKSPLPSDAESWHSDG